MAFAASPLYFFAVCLCVGTVAPQRSVRCVLPPYLIRLRGEQAENDKIYSILLFLWSLDPNFETSTCSPIGIVRISVAHSL